MLFMMFIVCSPRVTWFSSCSSRVHSFWHGFHNCSSCVMVFDMVFIMCLHVFIVCSLAWFSSSCFMCWLWINPKCHVCFEKHQPQESRKQPSHLPEFWRTSWFLALICFFVCCPKVLPHFPIPTTVLTAKEIAYLALIYAKTLPIKMAKIHHRKHLLAEWLRVCLPFFGTNMSFEVKKKQPACQDSLLDMARVDFKPSIQK